MTDLESKIYYAKIAQVCAENSKATKLKVGAIIVKDKQIISDGFNGTPSGFDNTCEANICNGSSNELCYHEAHLCIPGSMCNHIQCSRKILKTKPEVLHAESNAILKCAKFGRSTDGADIYITHAPCIECAKLIIQAGIKNVYYINNYRSGDGIKLLEHADIYVERIKL